jgi:hypothetical protein
MMNDDVDYDTFDTNKQTQIERQIDRQIDI